MKLVAISIASWAAGLVAYLGALRGIWGQGIGSGDLRAVMFWSVLAATVAIVAVYAPTMFALRDWLGHRRAVGWVVFPIVGMALGVLPVLFIIGL